METGATASLAAAAGHLDPTPQRTTSSWVGCSVECSKFYQTLWLICSQHTQTGVGRGIRTPASPPSPQNSKRLRGGCASSPGQAAHTTALLTGQNTWCIAQDSTSTNIHFLPHQQTFFLEFSPGKLLVSMVQSQPCPPCCTHSPRALGMLPGGATCQHQAPLHSHLLWSWWSPASSVSLGIHQP